MMEEETRGRSGNRIVALFPDLLGVGGIQVAGRLTAAALSQTAAQYGWIVDFLSLNDPFGAQMLSSNGEDIRFRGFARSKARFILAALAAARKQARVVVAVHPHLALVAAKMNLVTPRMKIAVISHGVEVWRPLSAARRKASLKADVLAAPSRYTIEQIVRLQGVPIGRTRLLPWPLDPDFLEMAEKAEVLPSLSGFPQGLVVLAIARLASDEKYKGVDHLIRAVAQLAPRIPSLYLVVAASGDDIPRHQEIARELGLSDRVRFFRGLSPAEIAGCYSRCDVFALPSTGEGFGFVFLEAMAFGKPVVGAAAGGVTDIVEHEQNGLLVRPGDLNHLVECLARLLQSASLRAEFGRRGAEMARSKFQFDRFRSRLEEIVVEK
jgi:phosphatidyl-myo-inositol dimannoside synthase